VTGSRARWLRCWWLVALALSATAAAQTTRRATNIAALLVYPGFYHERPILIVGKVEQQQNGDIRVSDANGSVRLIARGNAPDGVDEVRGEFWDVGRMKPDDPRLASVDLRTTFHVDPEGAWPRPGEATAIVASSVAPAQPIPMASIRAVVLEPTRYVDEKVTLVGQYAGRNLMGDLPDAPGKSRYDFVLRSADAAIWVTNLRPKGKDANGKDFELGLDARIDTGRWLQVTGTLRQGRGLEWIDGEAGSFKIAAPEPEVAEEEPAIRVPIAPAPEVVFSAPAQDETDVAISTNVRIQFSRDIEPATLKGNVRVSYVGTSGDAALPASDYTLTYNAAIRVLVVTFAKPFDRFRTVKVAVTNGILGTDKQPVKPWTLTFELGG
jgi:hypothetical protein